MQRFALATLVLVPVLVAATPALAAGSEAKGTFVHGSRTTTVKYAYLIKGPDVVSKQPIRRLILSATDLGAKIAACKSMSCTDSDLGDGLSVNLDGSKRLNYWLVQNDQRVQYSGTEPVASLAAKADDAKAPLGHPALRQDRRGRAEGGHHVRRRAREGSRRAVAVARSAGGPRAGTRPGAHGAAAARLREAGDKILGNQAALAYSAACCDAAILKYASQSFIVPDLPGRGFLLFPQQFPKGFLPKDCEIGWCRCLGLPTSRALFSIVARECPVSDDGRRVFFRNRRSQRVLRKGRAGKQSP